MIDDNSEEEGRRYCQLRSGDARADPLPHFQYQALQPRCIRILKLLPGQRSDPFQGRFTEVNIDSGSKFDALSYMWGDATQADRIVVAFIPIAWNLARALEYMRDSRGSRPLSIWIDAICIDQNNLDERAEQVAIMRAIYRNATCVRIWINEPSLDEKSAAVAALKCFRPSAKAENDGLGKHFGFWGPLIPMFQNDYWSRIWMIVQSVGQLNHSRNDGLLELKGNIFGPSAIEMFAVHGDQRLKHDLIALLTRSGGMQVSKGHDRLYALMHLAGDYEEGGITVDYEKNEQQVMADAAAYHINLHQNLNFLTESFRDGAEAAGISRPHETTCLTWIPEGWMGRDTEGIGFDLEDVDDSEAVHNRGIRHTECPANAVDIKNLRLSIRGVRLGWVRQCFVSSTNVFTTVSELWASSLGEYLQLYLERASTSSSLEFSRAINDEIDGRKHDHECIRTGLSYSLELSKAPEQASRSFGYGGEDILDLLAPLEKSNPRAWFALRDVLRALRGRYCIKTNDEYFGRVPECNIREKDEIWLVLGCPQLVVLRRQPSGRYWHICPVRVPALDEHEDVARVSSKIQPGDKIDEWTVEDIELE
ncbi:heterokaryon incompatibility protein-domain-containing protein [Alternaria rosae]|uniref:heterokaryon incompatibility protein-domain-containing protein n=1 Tax=Alternaria rosae TaxID=1187941 RepID=UPI001E8D7554|nr:heterokaryon incompatibility protein-domain-containing protein [Alternaria rosae]KAH6870346.1 heterokaryon incompatibility protein-domain-containing protein [Alternaria rosae]